MQPIIELEQIRFRWPKGQREVLNIPQMKINKGESVFLKGKSGSGKTTLLSLIGGINTPEFGSVQALGEDIISMKQSERDQFRADHIGFIFQLFNLIPYLSVLENIVLTCSFSKLRTNKALAKSKTLELEALRLLSHLKLDTAEILHTPVVELSVGQQQRVATARALMGSPELIIADEPTSALDADTREHFIQLLLNESKESGSTVLFVSHDSSLESNFSRSLDLSEINLALSEADSRADYRGDYKANAGGCS